MDEILSKGSKEDIKNFVATKNILNPNIFRFSDIYYLLKDREFYLQLVEILRRRKIFDFQCWSYSILHGDMPSFVEFINSE
jgi:hypothetical protein